MYKHVVVLIAILVFSGCQNIEYPEKPNNLIPEDKMVEILIDIQLFNTTKTYNRLPLQQGGLTPFEYIYERHEIDSIQFLESNNYYGANLDTYNKIHIRIREYFQHEKIKADTLAAIEKRTLDSIKAVNDSITLSELKMKNPEGLKFLMQMDTVSD